MLLFVLEFGQGLVGMKRVHEYENSKI